MQLRIGRPKGYVEPGAGAGTGANSSLLAGITGLPAGITLPSVNAAGATSASTSMTPKPTALPRLQVSGIPTYLSVEQFKQITVPFGEAVSCELQKDPTTNLSKGVAIVQFKDAAVTENALKGLNGLKIGDSTLVVQKARPVEAGSPSQFGPMSTVVALANMVAVEKLSEPTEVEEMKQDVREECSRYGTVTKIAIPVPVEGQTVSGVGNVFVQFTTVGGALSAAKALHGRRFDGRDVGVTFCEVSQSPFA